MAHQLHEVAEAIGEVPRKAIPEAVAEVEDIAEEEARYATGDGRMSGMGRRGPKLRTVSRVSGERAKIVGVPAGAWAILEGGADAHLIKPRLRAGVLVGRSMRHPVRGPVRHPGSPAKRTWDRVLTRAEGAVVDAVVDEVEKAIR